MNRPSKAGSDAAVSLHGIRVARVSTVPFFVVTQLKHQIELLSASGAKLLVVTSDGPELDLLRALPGVDCVPIDIPRAIAPWRDLQALFNLWRFFRATHIDIAHSTTPKAGLLTAISAWIAGVPIRLHTFTGQPWIGMHGVKRWLAQGSDWIIGKLNTHCYADSMSQRHFLIEQGLLCANKISVIGSGSLAGVDIKRFDPERYSEHERQVLRQSLHIASGVQVLLFVGRITDDKGVRELLDAFVRLKTDGSRAHLIFVGPFDPDGGGGEGSISPREIDSIPDTHLVGYTECPEQYMAIADILCLPSYREGFGTVVIEAAAMGVPAVGTNIYGLSDAVEGGKTGLLVAPRDADSLYQALTTLLADEVLRARMGMAARQRAMEQFAANKVNAGVIDEYRQLLQYRELR